MVILAGAFLFTGCPKNEDSASKPPSDPKPTADQAAPEAPPEKSEAPARYTVELDTTKGVITIDVHREWAPNGADRFYELVNSGYYTDVAFFRVIDGFMAQVGLSGEPATNAEWRAKTIPDDPVKASNTRGTVTFATSGPNSRTTQFFINFVDNSRLDGMGFAPFGKVQDMGPVDALYAGYGEGAPRGRGPSQALIQSKGNAYLREGFPKLDYIKSAKILE
jgi:peptidyl-prolyl cis-trans isomerase A (cyclophilin A)